LIELDFGIYSNSLTMTVTVGNQQYPFGNVPKTTS